jgi:hypothetical protein
MCPKGHKRLRSIDDGRTANTVKDSRLEMTETMFGELTQPLRGCMEVFKYCTKEVMRKLLSREELRVGPFMDGATAKGLERGSKTLVMEVRSWAEI